MAVTLVDRTKFHNFQLLHQVTTGICGNGVGEAIAATKINGVRACPIHDAYSNHQMVK